jgi:NADH:ubiquinone oxidoreductase subunit 5 (subunit L)/multisubunit Na+/H+ antiporter MnhA subunit
MGDILSATSLLLTIITVLYGLWSQEIKQATNIDLNIYGEDNSEQYHKVNYVLKYKSFPLLVASLLLTFIISPKALEIINSSITLIIKEIDWEYNTVLAAYIMVWFFSIVISVYSVISTIRLYANKSKIKAKLHNISP